MCIRDSGHADLTAYFFLGPLENEIVGESLQASPFAVGQGTVFRVMIDMRAAAARAGYRVGRFIWVQTAVDLADACSLDIQLQGWRTVSYTHLEWYQPPS